MVTHAARFAPGQIAGLFAAMMNYILDGGTGSYRSDISQAHVD
jgi:hypothetical protein